MPSLTIIHPAKVWPSYRPQALTQYRVLTALLQSREWTISELVDWVYGDLGNVKLFAPEALMRQHIHRLRRRGLTITKLPGNRYRLIRQLGDPTPC